MRPSACGDALGPAGIVGGEAGDRPRPLPRRRRGGHRPRDVGEAAPDDRRGAARSADDVVPERRGLQRPAVVGGDAAADHDPLPAAGQRHVQQVAVEIARLRRLEPVAECVAEAVGQEGVVAAGGETALLQAEHDHEVGVERAGRAQIAHQHACGGVLAHVDAGAQQQPAQLLAGRRRLQVCHVVEHAQHGAGGGEIDPLGRRDAARVEAVRGDDHAPHGLGQRDADIARRPQQLDRLQAAAEQLGDARLDARRLVDRPPAQATLDEVDAAARQARPGRSQVREQIAPHGVGVPREAHQVVEREAEGGAPDRGRPLHHVRDAGAAQRLGQLGPADRVAWRDDGDAPGRGAGPQRRRHVGHDEVGLGPAAGRLEERHAGVVRIGGRRLDPARTGAARAVRAAPGAGR